MPLLLIFAAAPFAAAAGEVATPSPVHGATPDSIVVTAAFPHSRADLLQGVTVLQGVALTRELRSTIGETLARQPGVSATSFGPNSSRPVLRGFQGDRIRVLTDGIGAIDVSNTSVDHAVVIDPLLAERVEVLRGPSALLYGSSAAGGVVNVIDRRIPHSVPEEAAHVQAIAGYGSAADERSGGASVDVPVAHNLVVHADGSYLKTGDLEIGGYALTPQLRSEARATAASGLGNPDIDYLSNADVRGKLPNSAARTWTAGAGAALITEGGSLGLSYSHYDSLYGVPVRFATRPDQEQEGPRIDLKQNRFDLRAEVQAGGDWLEMIRIRAGYASYRHYELEEDGEIGTAFYNKGMEGRLELVQAKRGAWSGVTGAQFFSRDFNVVGDEAFLPKNETQQFGVFTVQQLDFGKVKAEAGARYERSKLSALPADDQPQFFGGSRSFDAFSASAGASYGFTPDWRLGVNLSRTTRAPSAEELFANGPHAGTEAFEVGDPSFRPEKSWAVEAVLRGKGPGYSVELSAYHNWFSNFIYQDLTGGIEDGLPVFQSYQARARYYGFEAQGSLTLAKLGGTTISADGLADYVRANIRSSGPAPRLPPLRLLGGLEAQSPRIGGRIEVEWADKQKRVSAFETETPGFTLVNASMTLRPWGDDSKLSFILSANNIFDVVARRSASFLKDYAPLAGRDFRITARANF